ncbi:MAG TPA: VOC family protein [Bryobacteraceae bacterium]|nr:VOC family protein [Bryobacteraceae bacterium]
MAGFGSEGLGRRDALRLMSVAACGALAVRPASGAERGLRFSALDHLEFTVSDLMRSVGFYARIFGNDLYKNKRAEKRYLKLGPTYLGIDHSTTSPRVDHHCVGIAGFDIAALHAYLERQGVAYKDYPSGRDLYFTDPDGTRTQLSTKNSWNTLVPNTVAPEAFPAQGEPIFRPTGMDHILLNVSDPEKSAAFYAQVFGPVSQRNNNRIWFQVGKSRVGLLKTPEGARAGVNHYCVSAEPFDYAAAVKKLEQVGAKVEAPEGTGAAEFRDPDGFLVQVMSAR